MRKTVLALAAAVTVSFFSTAGVVPPVGTGDTVTVTVDGARVDTYGLAYVTGGSFMVPLRSVSEALGADSVTWDAENNCARVTAPGLELWVPFDREYIEANGRCWYVPGGVDQLSGRCLVDAEYLAWAFGADLASDRVTGDVRFTSGTEPVEAAEARYDSDELYWLSRIINAEAGGEPFSGKIAVGNVIVNRVRSDEFPDTVKSVIFDRRYGVQFTPAYSGSINNTPSSDSVAAAKLTLEGVETVDGALYFASRAAAPHCWASRHYEVVAQISGHVFFG